MLTVKKQSTRRTHLETRRLLTTLLALLLCTSLALLIFTFYPSNFSQSCSSYLPVETQQRIEALLWDQRHIVAKMPIHKESAQLYQTVVSMIREEVGVTEAEIAQHLCIGFRDSNFGLFALQHLDELFQPKGSQRLSTKATNHTYPCDDYRSFLIQLCREYPNSRVATMALDNLLRQTPENEQFLREEIEKNPGTRMSSFGLLRLGDLAQARGDLQVAEDAWLQSWREMPARAPQLYNRLCQVWMERGDWTSQLLFDERWIEDPALTSLVVRIGERRNALPEELRVALDAVSKALQKSNVSETLASLQQLADIVKNAPVDPQHKADLSLAAFLVGMNSDTSFTTDLQSELQIQHDLATVRLTHLELALQSLPSLDYPLQAVYRIRAADRALLDLDPATAAALVKKTVEDSSVPVRWKKRALHKYLDLLTEEYCQYAEAADYILQFLKTLPDGDDRLKLEAARQYSRAGQYAKAVSQFETLRSSHDGEVAVEAIFSCAVCYLRIASLEAATTCFHQVLTDFPQATTYASESLYHLALIALDKLNYEDATLFLKAIVEKYPESDCAVAATTYLEKLKSRDS